MDGQSVLTQRTGTVGVRRAALRNGPRNIWNCFLCVTDNSKRLDWPARSASFTRKPNGARPPPPHVDAVRLLPMILSTPLKRDLSD